MKHDGKIDIALGMSAKSKVWKNNKILYSDFVQRLGEENKTNETYKEFISATREEQLKIKDVGGYVGGYLKNGRRSPKNVSHRQLITLDIDFAHKDFWEDFTLQFDNSAVLHSTHKHCEANPRFRLVMPLSRKVTPDEYVAVSRQIAGIMGIDLFDNSTFETNRLMFWPSNPKDIPYYFESHDGPWVDVDKVLDSYVDWKDTSAWPTADRKLEELRNRSKKQQDPELKKGIVGVFCRSYSIIESIDKFLKDIYSSTAQEDRFTYIKGTTAGGLILYEDKFAYSHHGTDPCAGKLSNSFDLVRIHLYGHLDQEKEGNPTRLPSYKAMQDLAQKDKKVRKIIAEENITNAKYDFREDVEELEEYEDSDDVNWMTELEVDKYGNYFSTSTNINIILANDFRLKDAFRQNTFENKRYVFRSLPWRKVDGSEPIKNVDYSGVRNYIESIYGITGALKIDDSMALEFEKNSFHPVRDYLARLEWDEIPRINRLLIDYFGAEDSLYTEEAMRKMLVGAVARVLNPGCKFDLVLTLVGRQATMKSSFFIILGREWFSDTFMTVHGKEALEQIQGHWIIEMAELAGLRKAEVEAVKHFITKQEDSFRPAYARASETFKRQCVFVGTTNKKDFLNDPSGNRRFMPVDVNPEKVTKGVWKELEAEVDQIWAEAVHLYRKKERLYLSEDAEEIAKKEQEKHSEVDERKGVIEEYLNKLLPKSWDEMDGFDRREFYQDILAGGSEKREFVCIAEIWCEFLGKERDTMTRYNTRDLNDIMRILDGWEHVSSTRNFIYYGKQKFYRRR